MYLSKQIESLMETTFLQNLAKEIHQNHPSNLEDLCFVFPSKRAGLFFKKELAKIKGKAFWAPQILTIDTFIEQLSGLTIISPLEQLFYLFEVHKKLAIEPQLPFDKFIDSAKIILADFNDIDMAMADELSLFENVKDYVELQHWDPSEENKDSLTQKYLDTFKNLPKYYNAYQTLLLDDNKAYQGLVYREIKKMLSSIDKAKVIAASQQWEMVYVAGLNALTPAERWLFDWFKEQKKLTVLFEAEQQMLVDTDQESGKFIREFAKREGADFKWVQDHLTGSTKRISNYAVNGNLAMSRMVGHLFSELAADKLGNETAIILADESLLMPVLESLPKNIGDVNVTLGFPLGLTAFMSFVEQLFGMQKLVTVRNGQRHFYFKDVMKVLTNPILVSIYGEDEAFEKLVKKVVKLNRVWIPASSFTEIFESNPAYDGVSYAFTDWKIGPMNSIRYFNNAIDKYQEKVEKESITDDVLIEQLYFFKTSLINLENLLVQFNQDLNLSALYRVFKQVISLLKVPFSGEPLAGIQIMGLLETRLLSFKNVIFVSVNEGVIPAKGGGQSLLPFSLRSGFGIQTHQDRDSLFAYHFYRILSKAENIDLIYDTSSIGVGSKEKSRFIRQIEQEWPELSANIVFENFVGVFDDEKLKEEKSIEKTPDVIANIKRYLTQRGLSPSALNNFLESPIDFYYKNVIGVYEPKSIAEDVEHNVFGTIVHACLEEFYLPFEKQVLSADKMKVAFKNVDDIIKKQFSKEIPSYERGKHYLSFYSVKNYVKRFLKLEIEFIENYEFRVTLIENELEFKFEQKFDDTLVKFKGIADRVESRQGITHIIDYKTGMVKDGDLKVGAIAELLEDSKKYKPKFVQLLMYAWLAHKQLKSEKVISGIFTLRDTKLNLLTAKVDKNEVFGPDDFMEFETFLKQVIGDMLNPELPLINTPDYKFALFY